jgi:integrase
MMTNIKFYPLPDGQFVVSYFDELRRIRLQQTFVDEKKAADHYNALKSRRPVRDQKRSLTHCTTEELMEVFLEEMPDASLTRSPQLIRYFLESFSFFKIGDIDELQLRSFYTRQKIEYDYTNHSLSTRKYQIQGFFKWLIKRGVIQTSPQELIRMGKSSVYKRKPIHLAVEDIQQAIAKAKELSPGFLYPILLLVEQTAAKTSDMATLKWTDIDFKNRRIRYQGGTKIQRRDLEISAVTAEALRRIDPASEFVFTTLEGKTLQKHILTRELKVFQRKAGIETTWVFRDLRHSFAVNYMKAGGDTEVLQKILGHWHPRLTEELYGRFRVHNLDFMDFEGVPGTGGVSSEASEFGEF